MYTAKHALLLKHKAPHASAYVFYMDIRAAGKGYEEFVRPRPWRRSVIYIRGRVVRSPIPGRTSLVVGASDTLSGQAGPPPGRHGGARGSAMVPRRRRVARHTEIPADAHGFLQELHPKLRPVETLTAGIFLAGAAQSPKDIPDAVAQASAAASKGLELLSKETMQRDPTTAVVNEAACAACFECVLVCPYGAMERHEVRDRRGAVVAQVARANPAVCEGCGLCTVACRGGNIDLLGCSDDQVFAQLAALGPAPRPGTMTPG